MATAKAKSVSKKQRALALELAALARTQGWTATTGDGLLDMDGSGVYESPGCLWVRMERTVSAEITVALLMHVSPQMTFKVGRRIVKHGDTWRGFVVEGDTTYNGRCFTRRGVDCASCYLKDGANGEYHTYGDVAALLKGELDRCVAADAYSKTTVPVPGLPFMRPPQWFTETAKSLRAGTVVRLYPHGMGTGYTLSRRRSTWGRPADPELVKKLGVGPVYVETFDHD